MQYSIQQRDRTFVKDSEFCLLQNYGQKSGIRRK